MKLAGIFSSGRSGSTLLMLLLDKIKDFYIHPIEIQFLSSLYDIKNFNSVKNDTLFYRKKTNLDGLSEYTELEKISNHPFYKYHEKKFFELLEFNQINTDSFETEEKNLKIKYSEFSFFFFKKVLQFNF